MQNIQEWKYFLFENKSNKSFFVANDKLPKTGLCTDAGAFFKYLTGDS